MNFEINPLFKSDSIFIHEKVNNFNSKGIVFGNGKRNTIKLFEVGGKTINIKAFKIPHFINKIVYRYFRKSKAKRSFEFANKLIELGIGTPQPIAYYENYDFIGLNDSYYVSEHMECDLTYRELIKNPDYPDYSAILRQFTQFTFDLHQKGIEFLDHSPGNTLIVKRDEKNYDFFLVDLNRMHFHQNMNFEQRMHNFSRLTPQKEMIRVMSNEYAKYYKEETEATIFERMWKLTSDFQEQFYRKKRLKKKLKFWES